VGFIKESTPGGIVDQPPGANPTRRPKTPLGTKSRSLDRSRAPTPSCPPITHGAPFAGRRSAGQSGARRRRSPRNSATVISPGRLGATLGQIPHAGLRRLPALFFRCPWPTNGELGPAEGEMKTRDHAHGGGLARTIRGPRKAGGTPRPVRPLKNVRWSFDGQLVAYNTPLGINCLSRYPSPLPGRLCSVEFHRICLIERFPKFYYCAAERCTLRPGRGGA